jgi:DNA-directed RNA polymerase subunit M/transcription elongation factor TFIIS
MPEATLSLTCPTCGNGKWFYQVQEHVENVVDGSLTHIKMLFADTAFYECCNCRAQIEPPEYK